MFLAGALLVSSASAFAPGRRFAAPARRANAVAPMKMGLGSFFKSSSPAPAKEAGKWPFTDMTEADVIACQDAWANAIKTCSKIYLEKGDYVGAAAGAAGELYGYGHSEVLFKPTKAKDYPFRPTAGEAMSYFVGGGVVEDGYAEDGGFAINGGKGFSDVVFTNHKIYLNGPVAIAMGSYVFTCATTGEESKVEYTFATSATPTARPASSSTTRPSRTTRTPPPWRSPRRRRLTSPSRR
jgi:hypothetical protein